MIPLDFNPFQKKSTPKQVQTREQVYSKKNWIKCPKCGILIYEKQLRENFNVCPKCEFLFKLDTESRIKLLFDSDSFQEMFTELQPKDVLTFADRIPYSQRLQETKDKTKTEEAIRVGTGKINSLEVAVGIMDFQFIGGSMGMVVGEKIVRITEYANEHQLPLLIVSSSGGARMQEGMYSLIQMARTSSAIGKFQKNNGLYISLLTHPTTGGVSASFAFLGDIILAEPGALIGFAGPRVIEQTTKQKLPAGFQTAEFLLEHGQIDKIVKRKNSKNCLSSLFQFYTRGNSA